MIEFYKDGQLADYIESTYLDRDEHMFDELEFYKSYTADELGLSE